MLSVVAYHAADGKAITGGFLGVDIFFVLSGFLITTILVNELNQGTYTIVDFYKRRARRLIPALALVLIAVLVAGLLVLSPPTYVKTAQSAVATLLFSSNTYFMLGSGYFEEASHLKPLLHTWSLAVEEQFYILYPLIVALVFRFKREWLLSAIVLGLVASFGAQLFLLRYYPTGAFFLAPARAYELLAGAVIALCKPPSELISPRHRGLLAAAGLAGLALCLALLESSTSFPGIPALLVAGVTAATLWSHAPRETLAGRVLSWRPLTWFGDISYSLYLWHWPLLVFGRHWALGDISPWFATGLMLVATMLAWGSYRFVEQPFVRGLKGAPVFAISGVAAATLLGISTAVILSGGVESRLKDQSRALLAARNDYHPLRRRCHADGDIILTAATACVFGDRARPVDSAVWGDSHAAELAFALGELAGKNSHSVMQFSASACPPALGYAPSRRPNCFRQNESTIRDLTSRGGIRTVYLVMNFAGYPAQDRPAVLLGFEKAVLRLLDAGKTVTLFSPIPILPYDPPSALQLLYDRGEDYQKWGASKANYILDNAQYSEMLLRLSRRNGVRIIDSDSVLCESQYCAAYKRSVGVLYFNADHLSLEGARLLARASQNEPKVSVAGLQADPHYGQMQKGAVRQ